MTVKHIMLCLLLPLTFTALNTHAEDKILVIGTKISPPFVMQDEDGRLTGISILLWEKVAAELGWRYKFEQRGLADLISGVQDGSLDASIAALTITPEREKVIDFTHPFYTSGLSIATISSGASIWKSIGKLFSAEFLYAVTALAMLLLAVAFLLWLVEHKHNTEQFGGSVARGLGASFWWAAVTMTTVGYGDKTPVTFLGRIIGLIWMFAAIILISSFTAAIATSLTVNQLNTKVSEPNDLPKARVAVVAKSSAAEFLTAENISFKGTVTLEDAMQQLIDNKADAVVYDAPLMQYLANTKFKGRIQVLPNIIRREDYSIALPPNSKLREPLNQTLLKIIGEDFWQDLLNNYLGPS